jgi:Flp pilus assembly CpaF family ATPase
MNCDFFLSILAPLRPLYEDATVNEIRINPNGVIYVERAGRIEHVPVTLAPSLLRFAVCALAGAANTPLNDKYPKLDVRHDDGSRVAILAPPLVPSGYALTIRRFPTDLTLPQLVERDTLSQAQADALVCLLLSRKNLLISGSTRAGKTTLARALLNLIPHPGDRLVLIEQPAELNLAHSDVRDIVPIEVRDETPNAPAFTATDALKAALRHSPDRIILGELRGGEAADFLEALNTGHPGSLTTLHANSATDALDRLITLVRRGDPNAPRDVIVDTISSAIHAVVHTDRTGGRRVVSEILTVTGVDPNHTRILTAPFHTKGDACNTPQLSSNLAN